jgi:hypothetical protein
MKSIAYVIGYRWTCDEDRRLFNLKITLDWLLTLKSELKKYDINLIIVVVEQDASPKFCVEQEDDVEHLFIFY